MKKIKAIFFIIIIITLFQLIIFPTTSKAWSIGEIIKKGDQFIEDGNLQVDTPKLKETQGYVFNLLSTIGIAITLIWGGYIGIKFMIASVEDKAKIKEMLIPYIIGCVAIYGALAIWAIVVNIGQDIAPVKGAQQTTTSTSANNKNGSQWRKWSWRRV